MKRASALLVAATLACNPACAQGSEPVGRTQLKAWYGLIDARQFDRAAALMIGDAAVGSMRDHTTTAVPARVFVEWLTHCRAGGMTYPMADIDGKSASVLHLDCEARNADGGFVRGSFPVNMDFFAESKGDGVRVWSAA